VEHIEEQLRRELDCRPAHVEGRRSADWILMDYIDFVVHVFVDEKRNFYRLERLWGDAPRVDVSELAQNSGERTQASLPPTGS
jgi:ribosome-associated protein